MNPKTSLFARARPRVVIPKTKKARGFLGLPGEIRNQIYHYCFQDNFRCELVGKDCSFIAASPKTVKFLSNARVHSNSSCVRRHLETKSDNPIIIQLPPRRSMQTNTVLGSRTSWLDSYCALVLVCKQMHAETLVLLYQRTTFVFEAPRRITLFLQKRMKQNLDHVTKLHFCYDTYGSPSSVRDVIWQEKHIESWARACKVSSKSLTCLQRLKIDIWVNEDAPKFNLRQKWLQPVLQFRRLTYGSKACSATSNQSPRPLQTVIVRIRSRLWAHDFMNPPLSKACKHLHRLFGEATSHAILGAKEEVAMNKFNSVWNDKYKIWQHHLGFAKTGW